MLPYGFDSTDWARSGDKFILFGHQNSFGFASKLVLLKWCLGAEHPAIAMEVIKRNLFILIINKFVN